MMKVIINLSIVIYILISAASTYALPAWYHERYRGFYWFEDKKDKDRETREVPTTPEEAVKQLHTMQKELEESKALMVMAPTVENAAKYIALQKEVLGLAGKVSVVWQAALTKYPELDANLMVPVAGRAKEINREITRQEEDMAILEFSKHFGLVVVEKEGCKYCEEFSNILQSFIETYKFDIASLKGENLSNSRFRKVENKVLLKSLNVQYVPALFAYNSKTGKMIVVGYGFMPYEDLRIKLLNVIKYWKNYEYVS